VEEAEAQTQRLLSAAAAAAAAAWRAVADRPTFSASLGAALQILHPSQLWLYMLVLDDSSGVHARIRIFSVYYY
jgi:hypothetical protein